MKKLAAASLLSVLALLGACSSTARVEGDEMECKEGAGECAQGAKKEAACEEKGAGGAACKEDMDKSAKKGECPMGKGDC